MGNKRDRNRKQPAPKHAGSGFFGNPQPAPATRRFIEARRSLAPKEPPADGVGRLLEEVLNEPEEEHMGPPGGFRDGGDGGFIVRSPQPAPPAAGEGADRGE